MNKLVFTLLMALCIGLIFYLAFSFSVISGLSGAGSLPSELRIDQEKLTQIGIVENRELNEISGIVASKKYPGFFWVHNDSGNAPAVFLLDQTAKTVARIELKNCRARDWEDICVCDIEGQPYICVGDVGDNAANRKSYQLHIFTEPEIEIPKRDNDGPVKVELEQFTQIDFNYVDGAKNCEAMIFDKRTNQIILIEKSRDRGERKKVMGIYAFALDLSNQDSNIATKISNTTRKLITAADMTADGNLVICDYLSGGIPIRSGQPISWSQPLDQQLKLLALPVQRQREAICFTENAKSVVVASEFSKQPLWKVNLKD